MAEILTPRANRGDAGEILLLKKQWQGEKLNKGILARLLALWAHKGTNSFEHVALARVLPAGWRLGCVNCL